MYRLVVSVSNYKVRGLRQTRNTRRVARRMGLDDPNDRFPPTFRVQKRGWHGNWEDVSPLCGLDEMKEWLAANKLDLPHAVLWKRCRAYFPLTSLENPVVSNHKPTQKPSLEEFLVSLGLDRIHLVDNHGKISQRPEQTEG